MDYSLYYASGDWYINTYLTNYCNEHGKNYAFITRECLCHRIQAVFIELELI